jgi:hypothetical protein
MTTEMSDYEQRAWDTLTADERSRRGTLRARAADRVSKVVSGTVTAAGDALKKLPGVERITDVVDEGIQVALNGAATANTANSWHVDLCIRNIGYLGVFRRSLKTGLWFTGPQRYHSTG